jgi:hypothetical protein
MTERQRRYREEVAIDALMELGDIEGQYQPVVYDDLLSAAQAMLSGHEKGVVMRYPMLVVLEEVTTTPMHTGQWRYKAYRVQDVPGVQGCAHTVEASSLRQARIDARMCHLRQCVGRE